MYENLIETMRFCAKNGDCHTCPHEKPCVGESLYCEAADAIEELTRENESLAKSVNEASEILRRRWIPVTERLPEQGRQYLVLRVMESGETVIETLWHDGEKLWWNRLYEPCGKITHWMPIPEPPTASKEET